MPPTPDLDNTPSGPATRPRTVTDNLGLAVAIFVGVEIASGAIQGYYGPILVDMAAHLAIAPADLNWLEAAQLTFAALVVPLLARLSDLLGHRTVLLGVSAVTAAATWAIALAPSFSVLLVAWTLQGCAVAWLPLEVALIHRRSARHDHPRRTTRRASALLVATLQVSIIGFAILAGQVPHTVLLMAPAVAVTACIPALWWLGPDARTDAGELDWAGFGWLALAVAGVLGGPILMRVQSVHSPLAWGVLAAGSVLAVRWWRHQFRHPTPLVDVRFLTRPTAWPVQATAFLVGMSLLGAQVPLSTYFRSDPAIHGYGLGLSAAEGSIRMAWYVLCLGAGALLLPLVGRRLGNYWAMALGASAVAGGFLGWQVWAPSLGATWALMATIGFGSGLLVAGIPAAAAAGAPSRRVASLTGLTNAAKTLGGAVAASLFALCLAGTDSISGYRTVWAICTASGVLAVLTLAFGARANSRLMAPTEGPTPPHAR